ncbi:O-acyltransferase like protein-like [Dendronephthya gigantea]|uniref:O-acyltransferase like protein-like n=1 Tax=Dendronephthya gigantea TaxID=151771 RepID=UPI00106AED98|nr:O-acyltransferase like protein-like [Dendronephthya gigantea]
MLKIDCSSMALPNWKYILLLNIMLWYEHTRANSHQSSSQSTDNVLPTVHQDKGYLLSGQRCGTSYSNLTEKRFARLLDASGKQGSGIYGGNTLWYGSYSECSKLSHSQYCWTLFPGAISLVKNNTDILRFEWGVCIPDSCTAQDVSENLGFFLNKYKILDIVQPLAKPFIVQCAKDPEYTSSVVITIVFCCILIGLCLLATIVDILRHLNGPRESTEIIGDGDISLDKNDHEDEKVFENERKPLLPNGSGQETVIKDKTGGIILSVLDCFSCQRNIKFIMNTDVGKSDLTYLHGIRVISMFWIIYIHANEQAYRSFKPIENMKEAESIQRRFTNMISPNGAYGVDTFFLLSGLLVMYVNIKKQESNPGRTNWFKYYFHRFWRLTPTYMFFLLFVAKLVPFCGAGPIWFSLVNESSACSRNWWISLLYINNFHKVEFDELCMGHTWYLAADMQFFVISPIFLVIAKRYKLRPLICVVGVVLLASIITTASLIADEDLRVLFSANIRMKGSQSLVKEGLKYYKDAYIKPYCRIPPYVIGMVMGYFIYKYFSTKFQLKRKFIAILWILAVCVALAVIYAPYSAVKENPRIWSKGENVVYGSLRWTIWSFCISWLIFSCHYNYAGPVKILLAAKFWIPLSRINYAAFIVHFTVLKVFSHNIEVPIHYTVFSLVSSYLTALVLSYAIAFIVAVVVELPCANLEALVWKKRK